ncbi:MAG TPA: arginase family protein [Chitinophagaceae bacterium]|jgi:arginase
MRKIILIEAPSNLGLQEPLPGVEPGVKFFPAGMEKENFAGKAGIEEKISVIPPAYTTEIDTESKVRNAGRIIDYSKQLSNAIDRQIQNKKLSVVIGGDCSILLGAALSLKRNGNYGLFFLDGHTDYVLPEQSGTAGAAGMDLAIVTGNGHQKLTNIENLKPYIQEENVYCCGNRETDVIWYVNAIVESDINYYNLSMLRSEGMSSISKNFLTMIESKKLDGFWIHFDVDVLNDEIMPCVDSRQEDGLSYDELRQTLTPLISSPLFVGIDVTIFDPTLDKDGHYIKQFATELADCFEKV